MYRKGLFVLALGIIGVVVLATAARQALTRQPLLRSTQVKLEQSYILVGPVTEDLVVLAEVIHLQPDSRVTGNVALIGDTV
jgi:hypothetical protein